MAEIANWRGNMAEDAPATKRRVTGTFSDRQLEFAAHLRDPEQHAAPTDVEDRRMRVYRDLFFNNISGFMANGFEVLRSCMNDDAWRALMRDFYRDHASRTPLFTQLYSEFVTYLNEEREPQAGDPPFLTELAHYEWVGLDLLLAPDSQPGAGSDPDSDLLDGRPVLSPLTHGLSYNFPVNEINTGNQPTVPLETPVYLLAYRNADDRVKFVKLNIVSARLFALIDTRPELSGRDALNLIVDEMQHPKPETVIEGGHAILNKWRELGVVLGARSD